MSDLVRPEDEGPILKYAARKDEVKELAGAYDAVEENPYEGATPEQICLVVRDLARWCQEIDERLMKLESGRQYD